MAAILRSTGAVGLMFAIACGAVASITSETNCTPPDWQETCMLPSVTAGSRVIHDEQVTPAGDNEATEKSAASEGYENCDSCQSCMTCGCEPSCYAMVGTVFLHRSRPDSAAVVTVGGFGQGTLVNASDLDFGWDAGPDITLGRHLSNGLIVEGRFFSDRSAEANSSVSGVSSFTLVGVSQTFASAGDLINSYNTDLNSSELNVGMAVTPGCTFFTGFRWIELHDALRTSFTSSPFDFLTNWDESNHLYGGQIGTNILFTNPCSPFQFTGTLKAGAYGNVADNDFDSTIIGGARDHDDALSFVGEVDFTALYHVTQHVGLYGGIQVMWLDNVALAGAQAPTTNHSGGVAISPINTDGRLFYDGVTTGIDVTW